MEACDICCCFSFPAITNLPQSPTGLWILVTDSQLSWLPVATKYGIHHHGFLLGFLPRAIVCLVWVCKDVSQNGGSLEDTKTLWVSWK